jgi:hypothetical protein
MAAKAKAEKTLQVGDVATFEVVTPFCGLEAGETKTMKVTRELLYCIEQGLWKLKK